MSLKNFAVVAKEEGDSFWQPRKTGGYITVKVSPWNVKGASHTIFLDCLMPGSEIGEHQHADQEEIFVCLSGEAIMTVDGVAHDFKPESVAYIGKHVKHSFKNVSDEPCRFMVTITPAGLEERLKLMGKPRKEGDPQPDIFESPLAGKNSHGVER